MELKLVLLLSSILLLLEVSSQPLHGGMLVDPVVGRNKTKFCSSSTLRDAILYSCGGTRWKREAMDPPLPESVQTRRNKVLENVKQQSTSDPELKHPQGDGPVGKEPSQTDIYEYSKDDKRNIPEVKEDPAWKSADLQNDAELKQVQHDHVSDTEPSWKDFLNVYKKVTVAGAKEKGWESSGQKEKAKPRGSDFLKAELRRRRNFELEMAIKCCDEGCTAQDIASVFCLN